MCSPLFTAAVSITTVLLAGPAHAADKAIVLDVENANCELCPPIVRQSLLRVPGVKDVKTSQAARMADFLATVTFDDMVTDASMLIAATTNSGYPSHVANAN
jgi:periplasmic mercuric ion binding protein